MYAIRSYYVRFNQSVDRQSVAEHLFFVSGGQRWPALINAKIDDLPDPRQDRAIWTTDESAVAETSATWFVIPQQELPLNAHAELKIEPGVQATEGPLTSEEDRVVVQFDTVITSYSIHYTKLYEPR